MRDPLQPRFEAVQISAALLKRNFRTAPNLVQGGILTMMCATLEFISEDKAKIHEHTSSCTQTGDRSEVGPPHPRSALSDCAAGTTIAPDRKRPLGRSSAWRLASRVSLRSNRHGRFRPEFDCSLGPGKRIARGCLRLYRCQRCLVPTKRGGGRRAIAQSSLGQVCREQSERDTEVAAECTRARSDYAT